MRFHIKLPLVNTALIPIKIQFALFYGGICPWINFGATVMKQMGYSTDSVGVIIFAGTIVATICKVLLSIIGDKYHKAKVLLFVSVAMTSASILAMPLIPDRQKVEANLHCDETATHLKVHSESIDNLKKYEERMLLTYEIFFNPKDPEFAAMCEDWYKNSNVSGLSRGLCGEFTANIVITEVEPNTSQLKGVIWKMSNINDGAITPICSKYRKALCYAQYENTKTNSVATEILQWRFWMLFFLYSVYISAGQVACTVMDTVCFLLLDDRPDKYGAQRMFGSISWGISCLICGLLIDGYSDDNVRTRNYLPMFIFSSVILALGALATSILKVEQSTKNVYHIRNVRKIFLKCEVSVTICWCLLMGILETIGWTYTFWYIEEIADNDGMKWMKTLQGVSAFCGAVFGDSFTFLHSGKFIKKVGINGSMSIVLLIASLRFFTISIVRTPLAAITVGWIDGVMYGLTYTITTSYANIIAAPGTETTVQAIFGCIYDAGGMSFGSLIGGFVYNSIGGLRLFQLCSMVAFASAICHASTRWLLFWCRKEGNEIHQP